MMKAYPVLVALGLLFPMTGSMRAASPSNDPSSVLHLEDVLRSAGELPPKTRWLP